LWRLGDSRGYLSLLDQYWPKASDEEGLLRLLPLACAVALRDEKQRAAIVNSVVRPEMLDIGTFG